MVKIYCIEDCNNVKYVGSTKETLNKRLGRHKRNKRANRPHCSCSELQLDNCKIYCIEECSDENRKKREKYWILNTDCVNTYIPDFDKKKWSSSEKNKSHKRNVYHYRNSWGGDERSNNNLLLIDLSIFN